MDLKKLGGALKDQFAAFKTQHDDAVAELVRVRGEIDRLNAEQAAILAAPVSCEDWCDVIDTLVEKFASEGRKRAQILIGHRFEKKYNPDSSRCHGTLAKEQVRWDNIQDAMAGAPNALGNAEFNFATLGDPTTFNGPQFDFVALCTILEEPIKAGLRAAYMSTNWPHEGAMSTPDRLKRLEEIEAERKPLQAQEAQLSELIAATAGTFSAV